ncbi:MAG TPA: ROK family transcriptional regulator [Roseiarcus sp.]|nr:ROK family transcriptional regulator [Roseiarcus sp.]
MNELRALDVLFREGAMSRADLARALGLNRSTTGSIVSTLLAESLAVERPVNKNGEPRAQTGRPGIEVELNPGGALFIGAEIEVEQLTVVAIDLTGRLIRRESAAFPAGSVQPEKSAARIARMIEALMLASPDPSRVRGICVAAPTLVEAGVARLGLLLNWRDVPIGELIRERLHAPLPVLVENDANAFAIAETYSGNSRSVGTVAFVVIESGAGGGIVSDGRLFRGSGGMAGEFGHLRMGGIGYAPGGAGMLESYIGRDAVLARYRHHGGSSEATIPAILQSLESGEPAAMRTATDWGKWLARGLSHIVNLLNPGLVIIGGSVGRIYSFVANEVEAAVRAELRSERQMPRIEMSELGDEGPALGAALILHQRMFSVDERAIFPKGGARGLIRMAGV